MMVDYLDKLNINQMRAVLDDSRACLVNAQVGSGKTTVLISKVCYLFQQKQVSLSDMVVLTFTNKAANEIKERLLSIDSALSEDDLTFFGTFHSVALHMLKSMAPLEKIGYSNDFAVMDADEKTDLATTIAIANNLDIKYINRLEKRMEKAIHGELFFGNMKYPDDIAVLVNLYTQEKKVQNKMDFDDLIRYITELLPEISYRPKWIIIDEFQDTDINQMTFIQALTSPETKLFAVGDPNQIIYSWRGSNHNIFNQFQTEYNATQITLPENYRSSATILEVAKCFLESGNELKGFREPGNKIKINNHYDAFNEAQYLALSIKDKVDNGLQYRDIAIFYRKQNQSHVLEDVFSKEGIPYEVSLKKTIKDIPVLKWAIHLLRAATNPHDIESVVAVLSDSQYGENISKKEARKIVKSYIDFSGKSSISSEGVFDLFAENDTDENDECDSVLILKVDGFRQWCSNHCHIVDVYDYFDIDNNINPTSATFADDKESVIALLKKIDEYISVKKADLYDGVKTFVNSSALYGIDILSEDVRETSDSVKLMTLHAAKGLEFNQVYIIGVNNGLIPLFSKNQTDEKEEKRLFFVGITRAKNDLELSYYTSPFESRIIPGPSSYISLIPKQFIDMDGYAEIDTDLQMLRREITENKELKTSVTEEEKSPYTSSRFVKHPKYGTGIVVTEDDDMITVDFEGYGEKEFIKAFSELENLE